MNLKLLIDAKSPARTTVAVEQDGIVIGVLSGVQRLDYSVSSTEIVSKTSIEFSNLPIEILDDERQQSLFRQIQVFQD